MFACSLSLINTICNIHVARYRNILVARDRHNILHLHLMFIFLKCRTSSSCRQSTSKNNPSPRLCQEKGFVVSSIQEQLPEQRCTYTHYPSASAQRRSTPRLTEENSSCCQLYVCIVHVGECWKFGGRSDRLFDGMKEMSATKVWRWRYEDVRFIYTVDTDCVSVLLIWSIEDVATIKTTDHGNQRGESSTGRDRKELLEHLQQPKVSSPEQQHTKNQYPTRRQASSKSGDISCMVKQHAYCSSSNHNNVSLFSHVWLALKLLLIGQSSPSPTSMLSG